MHGFVLRGFVLLATAHSFAQAIFSGGVLAPEASYNDGAPMRLDSVGRSGRAVVGVTADGMTYDLNQKNGYDSYSYYGDYYSDGYNYDYSYDYSYNHETVDGGLGAVEAGDKCYEKLGGIAKVEGNEVGKKEGGCSLECCKTFCNSEPKCKSFSWTSQWQKCYLKDQELDSTTETAQPATEFESYFSIACLPPPTCDSKDGSGLSAQYPCMCDTAKCTTGQRCSSSKGCFVDPADGALVTIASSNMMGYYTWPQCNQDRLRNIGTGIKNSKATVLGVQEHPLWNTKGGDKALIQEDNEATKLIAETTGLKHSKYGVYYDPEVLEVVGTPEIKLICHTWESNWNEDRYISGTVFRIKGANLTFSFFNNHWDHGTQDQHRIRAVEFMKEDKWPGAKFLTGDFNNWGGLGEVGALMGAMNPAMKDALPSNENTWYDNCCKIDYILYTENSGVEVKSSKVDRDGAGGEGCWSGARADHALVYAQFRLTT